MASEPSSDEVRAHVLRVGSSAGFYRADRIRRLLEYTVEKTLSGKSTEIKEYALGVDVFERGEGFDPHEDAIVRVQARRLREKLLAYYEAEGAQERIRIEYRKGSYIPRILLAESPEAMPPRSLAVVPFVNLGPGSEDDYLCDGITEELIFQLSRVERLRVVSRGSSFALRGRGLDVRGVGQKLRADLIVEGTVRRWEDSVRITAQLISAEDGYHICSDRWDRHITDLLAIQDEIASLFVQTLRPHLAAKPPAAHGTDDREAYELYLKGRHFWNQRTEHGFGRAIEFFQAAIARDPKFARAWSALAETYLLVAAHHLEAPDTAMPKALEAVTTALALDPDLAPAHSAMAMILLAYERRPQAAERQWKQSLEIDPNYAHAWHAVAVFSDKLGQVDQAISALRHAERLEPFSAAIACDFGFLLCGARRYLEAIDACRRALDLHPSFLRTYVPLAKAHAALCRYDDAIRICLEARPLFRGRAFLGQLLAILGYSYGRSGRHADAAAIVAELHAMRSEHYVSAYDFATIHAGVGQRRQAIDCLRRAVDEHAFWLISLPLDPLFAGLRGDPEFDRIAGGIWAEEPVDGAIL